jgi:hypothetical protein
MRHGLDSVVQQPTAPHIISVTTALSIPRRCPGMCHTEPNLVIKTTRASTRDCHRSTNTPGNVTYRPLLQEITISSLHLSTCSPKKIPCSFYSYRSPSSYRHNVISLVHIRPSHHHHIRATRQPPQNTPLRLHRHAMERHMHEFRTRSFSMLYVLSYPHN